MLGKIREMPEEISSLPIETVIELYHKCLTAELSWCDKCPLKELTGCSHDLAITISDYLYSKKGPVFSRTEMNEALIEQAKNIKSHYNEYLSLLKEDVLKTLDREFKYSGARYSDVAKAIESEFLKYEDK